VLFADDARERDEEKLADDAFGFFWTEGLRGLGWCRDGVPTLKGGSTIGIPSPPGVWLPDNQEGERFVVPGVATAERMQGFRKGWTAPAAALHRGEGARWKLVGNAVTVGVSSWVG
jgi:DNA (cytosine-5)-methyltransferase 1